MNHQKLSFKSLSLGQSKSIGMLLTVSGIFLIATITSLVMIIIDKVIIGYDNSYGTSLQEAFEMKTTFWAPNVTMY